MNMEFNWLLLNGKAGPATTPLIVRLGRSRAHPLREPRHGSSPDAPARAHVLHRQERRAGRIPEAAWWPGNTVLVGVAQARDVEFVANNPGDWMMHCHLPHHMMNQMSSNVGQDDPHWPACPPAAT